MPCVAMLEKMAKREGFGDILADGSMRAAQKIGKGAEKYAVHIGGVELGMHDPKLGGGMAYSRYQMDATPGRHTQGFGPSGFGTHITNSTGMCLIGFGFRSGPDKHTAFFNAVTGLGYTTEQMLKCGERIGVLRHLFNLREGINELSWTPHPRIVGDPPQTDGPFAGVTINIHAQVYWNMGAMDWDLNSTKPSKNKLIQLALLDTRKNSGRQLPFPGGPPPPPKEEKKED